MSSSKFDVIVIGSGPGGYVAAIRASQLGLKTAVVEAAELGGVCLNWGCIPTKALIKSAQVFEYINHAADYGISVGDAKADFEGIIKRSRDVADGMSKGIQFLFKKNKIEHVQGNAKIVSAARNGKPATDFAYLVLDDRVRILAVAHDHRRPAYWAARVTR